MAFPQNYNYVELTSSVIFLSLSRKVWAPLYFSLRVPRFTPSFQCLACPPILSYTVPSESEVEAHSLKNSLNHRYTFNENKR